METMEARLDDRSPYAAAAAVVRTIAELSTDLRDDQAVWGAFASWRGADSADYIRTVRRTQHSLFYYQLQHLYEFGTEHVPAGCREDFCFLAGRRFTDATLDETIYPILQVALAQPGQFQTTVADMIRRYLYRFTGSKYRLATDFQPARVVLTLEDRFAEDFGRYVRQFGLEPARCFQNSFNFICGAVDVFASHIIRGYQTTPFAFQISGQRGLLTLPVAEQSAFDYEGLLQTLLGVIQQIHTRQRSEVEERLLESDLVVASSAMRETWNKVRRASQSEEAVLLLGESGTGKTFIAQKIHSLSRRREGPFIQVGLTSDLGSDNIIQSNLFGHERGAFTGATEQKQGLFSLADGGTILLDEIGDASPELQAKLLRVIDTCTFKRLGGVRDIRVDVRIIAATHHSLEALTDAGKFRRDLFYRLNVIPIHVPPLRDQPEAIPALADFLLARITRSPRHLPRKLAPELLPLLQRYPWPGNIRELEHALRHAVAMSDAETLKLADFPSALRLRFQKQDALGAAQASGAGASPEPPMIDLEALRMAIRATDLSAVKAADKKHELPCHIDFAKKAYLAALIEEFQGDLSLIGRYWDRHSEKTLRNLIKSYGLTELLHAARGRTAAV
jgi:DNA-binding NtrC family response regulator